MQEEKAVSVAEHTAESIRSTAMITTFIKINYPFRSEYKFAALVIKIALKAVMKTDYI